MNKIYQLVWNATYLCWQAVSEMAKGGVVATQSTTTIKSKTSIAHTVKRAAFFAVNVLSASIAFAGPTGGVVSSGTATISTAGTTTTINQSTAKAAIDWSSFSTNSNEIVNFVQPNSSSITLNRVTGTSASNLNGQLNANGQVFIINPNGVLFGSTSQVNTAGLVASTLNLSNNDFNNNLFNFTNTSNNKTVENRGKITVPTGGTVALIAPTVKHTGTINATQGNVLLAAGGDITLNLNNGSLLGYTINQGKAQALINSGGMIQADGGKVILTAKGIDELSNAVVNSVGVIQAQTVNNVRGVIELGSDLSSGTVNVSGTLDASAPNGGNGGQIKTAAAEVHVSSGTNITTQRNSASSLPPTSSGWELKAKNIDVDFFGGSVSSSTLGDALNKGNVSLNAMGTAEGQGNININDATSWNANTALTLSANKDINFNSDLDLSGDKAKLAMNYGAGSDYNLNNGAKINISGSSPTLLINGTSYIVINDLGEEGDANINTLQGMNNNLTGNYVLGSNIDASDTVNWNGGKGFKPIGDYIETVTINNDPNAPGGMSISQGLINQPFTGNFHGLGHSVTGLHINRPDQLLLALPTELPATFSFHSIGLFGATTNIIRDIGTTNGSIKGSSNVGGLIGFQKSGVAKNIFSSNSIEGVSKVGGLIGKSGDRNASNQQTAASILNSYATGNIKISNIAPSVNATNIGGLVGQSFSLIKDSYATGSIDSESAGSYGVGGLVGEQVNNDIIRSYATGNIWGNVEYLGGLVGVLRYAQGNTQIYQSYATGNLHGKVQAGGLIGFVGLEASYNNPSRDIDSIATVEQSYATGNVSAFDDTYLASTGGLIASINGAVKIKNSHATGDVNGASKTGGLVGSISNNFPSTQHKTEIENSYTTGHVTGTEYTGGLVGNNLSESIIRDSSAQGQVNGTNYVGGLVGFNGTEIINSSATGIVNGENYVGGLVGKNRQTIKDSYATGDVKGQENVGGLAGSNEKWVTGGEISNTYATGRVEANKNVGGLVGANFLGEISSSYASGAVKGYQYTGGLLGNIQGGSLVNTYAVGNVTGENSTGGLLGGTSSNNLANVENSFSSGWVSGTVYTGGLIGNNNGISIAKNSYWNTETSGQSTSAGGVGKNTAEMQKILTFTGWDIADVSVPNSTSTWVIDENHKTPWLRYNH
ncbi:filamentous hemagglutinin N-terminal domain-containing protein [Acinetobacter colistiniresistens]|uniref:GLUG motif-containing protein n=1 Tax=Acinetobacter colistiniresistens TaxID=280145 RepID=UPI00211BF8FC|nr:GLUG motif-containing protein [Acinetobacter colistiniresistens]UUM27507.1 filamentous hemagglutinin N-terminal domain-containing protein [Acinetobacter colistiniresistens]